MIDPATSEGSYVQPVAFQDGIRFAKVDDIILRILLLDGRDESIVLQVQDRLIEVLIVFLPEDFFEFLTVIPGVNFEIFVTVEDVESLDLHAGQITGH